MGAIGSAIKWNFTKVRYWRDLAVCQERRPL